MIKICASTVIKNSDNYHLDLSHTNLVILFHIYVIVIWAKIT